LVLTQPDRPAGRGMQPAQSPVKRLAISRGLALLQAPTLLDQSVQSRVAAARPNFLVVAAYGLILPQAVLDMASGGAFNIHASLLPRWRGAAPIQRALLAGDRETGITIMRMDAGLDTGSILAQQAIAIDDDDDAQTLHDKLADLGARMIVASLADAAAGRMREAPQPLTGVSYARKIHKRDAAIDWHLPAVEIERAIRALRPWPVATARLREAPLKIWRAQVRDASGSAGTVIASGADGVLVACAEDALLLTELQRAGGKRLAGAEFLRGCPIAPGERLQ
jgi:methionyl-tRNA formyltransferase